MRPEISQTAALGTLTLVGLYVGCVLMGWAIDSLHPVNDRDDTEVDPDAHKKTTMRPRDQNNVFDLVQALHDPSKQVVLYTVRRLMDLSAFKSFQTQIGAYGGIEALVNLLLVDRTSMDDETNALTIAIFLTLSNLTVHATNHNVMHAANLERVVADIYDEPSLPMAVKLPCLRLMTNLAMWSESSTWLLDAPVVHTLAADLLSSASDDWTNGILQLFANLTDPASMSSAGDRAAIDSIVDATVCFCELEGEHITPRQRENAQCILRNASQAVLSRPVM
ncbi:hypothetical protein H310_10815 [Aphanomyces invadans]|uniref:Armadillo repeat-containing domain-containing protein n=1 Tax=Aphanomyces invadans TaxID=157072 RepID=A0A024TNZ8_9STRA|nr:hypothetical protein H310_10815 [Aphanomyces invadans]ETV95743.1 hypothetical protein H310_10815 [Aphanomyces invadans]|eukprot:XP_008875494.1 hypothetical protein H310_10815 [Aphanomyces invadans]